MMKDKIQNAGMRISLYGPKSSSDYKKIILQIRTEELQHIIQCHDAVFGNEKEHVLIANDFFIQTSRSEGLPMGIIEAMSYGLPILVTEGTNMGKDVLKYGNGILEETSVLGVTRLLERVIKKDIDYMQMSRASIQAAKQYDINLIGKKTITKYAALLSTEAYRKF